jgi:hypothetical protein
MGRPRRYCTQQCRQRAYERRSAVQRTGLPDDAVVLSTAELTDLQDRIYQVRCSAEDLVTAADENATAGEMAALALDILKMAQDLERLR